MDGIKKLLKNSLTEIKEIISHLEGINEETRLSIKKRFAGIGISVSMENKKNFCVSYSWNEDDKRYEITMYSNIEGGDDNLTVTRIYERI